MGFFWVVPQIRGGRRLREAFDFRFHLGDVGHREHTFERRLNVGERLVQVCSHGVSVAKIGVSPPLLCCARYVEYVKPNSEPLPTLSALELAALASAALTGVQLRGYRPPLISNEDGQTLTVNDTSGALWLVWAPSQRTTEKAFARHADVLALLQEAYENNEVPFNVSLPKGVTTRAGDGVVLAHPHPGGVPLEEASLAGKSLLATSLARALADLHELDVDAYARASGARATAEQTRNAYRGLLKAHASSIPSALRRRWQDALDDDSLWRFEATPVHGNLSPTSVYVSPQGAVLGI